MIKKVVTIREAQLISMMKNLSPEEIEEKMYDPAFMEEMRNTLPADMLHLITESEKICAPVTKKIASVIKKKHGRITVLNPPTPERREDYYTVCMYVASEILGRALAMYEQEDRTAKLKDFQHLAMLESIFMRHGVDLKYADDDAEDKESADHKGEEEQE